MTIIYIFFSPKNAINLNNLNVTINTGNKDQLFMKIVLFI